MAVDKLTPLDRFVNTILLVAIILLWISEVNMLYGSWMP